MMQAVFFFFAGLTTLAAVFIVATRKLIYAAFSLFLMLFSVAGVFVLAGANFLAISQLVVYVGGILILLLFGIMLTHRTGGLEATPQTGIVNILPGILVSGGILAGLLWAFRDVSFAAAPGPEAVSDDQLSALAVTLFSSYLPAFELLSVLLLIALVAAAFVARRGAPQARDTLQEPPR
jgi:NADH-quinone oxidoreductase subunit J